MFLCAEKLPVFPLFTLLATILSPCDWVDNEICLREINVLWCYKTCVRYPVLPLWYYCNTYSRIVSKWPPVGLTWAWKSRKIQNAECLFKKKCVSSVMLSFSTIQWSKIASMVRPSDVWSTNAWYIIKLLNSFIIHCTEYQRKWRDLSFLPLLWQMLTNFRSWFSPMHSQSNL